MCSEYNENSVHFEFLEKMEQNAEEEPRVCQEPDVLKTLRPEPAESPPPNCAICLGTCTNKCFTDCCLHQFCFSCLLEWSKIKAECPLCKQPFKSIIYNIKSNLEYEEHIITNPERENQEDLLISDPSEYLFLPNGPRPQRHFQYRTTFTLEPGGELAIQQLLLSHPRTNSISFPSDRYPYIRFNSSTHSVDQRRNIYIENWWVDPQTDVTGRFRECSPHFFRENPAQAHRIIPWLNRELTSLINHTLIYPVQQQILDMLCQYPILSSQFRTNILPHLGARTDHFIHEFYNFVRSPYDMIGYDRHSTYRRHRFLPIYDLSDEDSDVHVVDSPENDDCVFVPNGEPEVIVIDSESSGNESDVIMRTPTPPPIVDLVNDSSTEEENNDNDVEVPTTTPQIQQQEQQPSSPPPPQQLQKQEPNNVVENDRNETRSPQLPIKIRLKRSRSSVEICKNYKHKEKRRLKRSSSTSSENSSSTESYNSSSKSSSDYYKYVKKKPRSSSRKHSNKTDSKYISKNSKYRYKKLKKSKRNSKKSKKQKKSKRRESEKRHKNIKIEKAETSQSSYDSSSSFDVPSSSDDDGDNTYHRRKKPRLFYEIKTEGSNNSSELPSQTQMSQYEVAHAHDDGEDEDDDATAFSTSPSASISSQSTTVAKFPSSFSETTTSTTLMSSNVGTAPTTTFSTNNVETNSDHWSTMSIASSCPSNNVPHDLVGVAGPSNSNGNGGVQVQSMVVVKDKNGSLWCRGKYQPSKRIRLYRPDLNRSSDNSSDSD